MSETVTIEKKVFDTLQKNNLDLMEKLDVAKKFLRIYADRSHWDADYTDLLFGWLGNGASLFKGD